MATKTKQYLNLCGGINSMTSGLLMDESELYHATNAVFDNIGTVEKSLGMSEWWDLSVTAPIYRLQQNESDYYAVCDGHVYLKNGTGKTDIGLCDELTNLEVINDKVYFVNQGGGISSTGGSTATQEIGAPGNIDILRTANGRLYAISGNRCYESSYPQRVATIVVGDQNQATLTVNSTKYLHVGQNIDIYDGTLTTKKKDSVTVSAILSLTEVTIDETCDVANGDLICYEDLYDTDTIMWSTNEETGDWFYVPGNDGNPVGAVENQGTLIIVKRQSVYRYTQTALSKIADIGTSSPNTITGLGNYALFSNNNGMYIIDGNSVYRVSNKVQKYFDNYDAPTDDVSTVDQMVQDELSFSIPSHLVQGERTYEESSAGEEITLWCAGTDGSKYRLWIGNTTHKNVDNCEIVFDIDANKFEIRSNIDASCYGDFVVDGSRGGFVGTSEGKVLALDSGLDYDGDDIQFILETKDDALELPGYYKLWDRVIFYTKPGTILNVAYSVDAKDQIPLGQITEPNTSFDLSTIRGISIKFILSESSSDELPGVYGYELSGSVDEEL